MAPSGRPTPLLTTGSLRFSALHSPSTAPVTLIREYALPDREVFISG
jgi:hypothetical protein